MSPERLQSIGDAGAKAAFESDILFCAGSEESGYWESEKAARAAFAEGVLKESGFYDLRDALKGVVSVADRKTAEFDLAHAAIAKSEGRAE